METDGREREGPPVVLRGSRGRWWRVLGVSVALAAANAWAARRGTPLAGGGVVFFGACALVAGLQLLPGMARLEIGREGFAYRSLFRRRRHAWSEVGPFSVATSSGVTFVVFDRLGNAGWLARANTALTGANDALPDTYRQAPHELAARMNAARESALRARS